MNSATDVPSTKLRQVRSDLERLLHFRPGTKITINIYTKHARWKVLGSGWRCGSGINAEDACQRLEFVGDVEAAIFGALRKLQRAGLTLTIVINGAFRMDLDEEADLTYDVWVRDC